MSKWLRNLLILALIIGIGYYVWDSAAVVGTLSGPNDENLTVNGVEYVLDPDSPYLSEKKGNHLGKVENGEETFHIHTIRATEEAVFCSKGSEKRVYVRVK